MLIPPSSPSQFPATFDHLLLEHVAEKVSALGAGGGSRGRGGLPEERGDECFVFDQPTRPMRTSATVTQFPLNFPPKLMMVLAMALTVVDAEQCLTVSWLLARSLPCEECM
jgi:hypothetical protein